MASAAVDNRPNAVAFRQMRYGLFVHQVYGLTAWPDGRTDATLDEFANAFDVAAFANQVASMGVEHVYITAWHKSIYCLGPNEALERWLPGHTSSRDLIGEIADALHAKGIKLVLYAHPNDGHDLTLAEQSLVGFNDSTGSYQIHNNFINEVYADLASRYANKPNVLGFWWDSWGGNGGRVDMPRLRTTVLDCFPGAIILSNYFDSRFIDFLSIEAGGPRPFAAMEPQANNQSFFLAGDWWNANGNVTVPVSAEDVYRFQLLNVGCGSTGGMTWALSPLSDGKTWGANNQPLSVFQTAGSYIAPVRRTMCNVLPSRNWVLPAGTVWSNAPAYVAARNPVTNVEYIHVMKTPAERFIDLPAPVESFTEARMYLGKKPVAMALTGGMLRLTLPDAVPWSALDTVIELTTDSSGFPAPATVMFDSAGGSPVSNQVVSTGDTIIRPADPARSGYRFVGWYQDSGLTLVFDFGTPVASDMTLYAKWTPTLQYATTLSGSRATTVFTAGSGNWTVPPGVTSVELLAVGGGGAGQGFGGGGGGGGFFAIDNVPVTPGNSVSVSVGAGGAGGSHRANDTGVYPNSSMAPEGEPTFFGSYAANGGQGGNWVWTGSGAGFGQGGTSGTNNQNSEGGLTADLPSNSYGSGSGVGVKGTAGISAAGGNGLSSGISGIIDWYGGGGGALVSGPGGQGGGGSGSPSSGLQGIIGSPNTGGGGGAGWAAGGGAGGSGVVIIRYGGAPSYTVAFNSNGGSAVSSQTVAFGNKATQPSPDPTKEGYDFIGWFSDLGLTISFDFDVTITGNTTLHAKWIRQLQFSTVTNGGRVITTFTDGGGDWTIPPGVNAVEVLVVGGGASGAGGYGGGGGGGGVCYSASYGVTPGSSVPVTVGAGGIGNVLGRAGNSGAASVFGSLWAYGGTSASWDGNSTTGGSSGGYSVDHGITVVAGHAGFFASGGYASGSGAGAQGSAGVSASGGAGVFSSIRGTIQAFAGGGGSLVGGLGVDGGSNGSPVDGTSAPDCLPNTGGGGGGGWGPNAYGGDGGSGVVIIAYSSQTPYEQWASREFANSFNDTDSSHDPDHDGLSNREEFAFGLDPTSGASARPVTDITKLNDGARFRYTKFITSGLSYTVRVSTDLLTWGPAAFTELPVGDPVNQIQTMEVTLTSLPQTGKLFLQVQAD